MNTENLKQCEACLNYFNINNFRKDCQRCRNCIKNKIQTPYRTEDEILKLSNLRRCKTCKEIKDRPQFYDNDGKANRTCKNCQAKEKYNWYHIPKNQKKVRDYEKNLPQEIRMFKNSRKTAREKNFEFNIEVSDIIIPEKCPILNVKLEVSPNGSHWPNSPSIDRVNNDKGYIKGNIRVISYRANQIKNTGTAEEHLRIADYILSNENSDYSI